MKNKVKIGICLLLGSIILFCYHKEAYRQEKINITGRIGFPEIWNIGVKYQLDKWQPGISLGYFEQTLIISGDLSFHFGIGIFYRLLPDDA